MIALRTAYNVVFMLCLLYVCRAHEGTKTTVKNDIILKNQIDAASDPYQYILSRLVSWMHDKRKNDKRNQEFDDDNITTMTRPFVTLAYAQTLDGMIAAKGTGSESIASNNLLLSCPQSMILTHHLRNAHDAILVGGSTFLSDQPRLNVRLPSEYTPSRGVRHPMPIVLDTNLHYLQRLIFGKCIPPNAISLLQSSSSNERNLPDIMLENIRAHNPIICCSSTAAQSFIDVLEVLFQEDEPMQSGSKRRWKKSYKISVFKKVDDHETEDNYMPIKIIIHITHHNKHGEDDTLQDITLTLLPCRIHDTSKSLDLRHVLSQLYNQFDIESVMVEGGAGILSSFLNECMAGAKNCSDERSSGGVNKVVDCICATIAPKIIGGKWGLPVLGGFDVMPHFGKTPSKAEKGSIGLGDDKYGMLRHGMMSIKDGEFVSLGQDATFLGRI
jgi:riboflavin biosynthesis pyrimidine reductase